MVSIEEFIKVGSGYGYGSGSGSGSGYGYGYGSGSGSGYGYGDGSGSGYGYGYGDGYGDGSGDGYGYGDGSGDGYGYGDGSGYGYGYGDGSGDGSGYGDEIKSINGQRVYRIDGTATIIDSVLRDNVAIGKILHTDLTFTDCYIVKSGCCFAHGETFREAVEALQEKLYSDETEEERIKRFNETYPDRDKKIPASELFRWHHILTGSCKAGREAWCKDKGIDLEHDSYTVTEFITLTEHAYGGEVIRHLRESLPTH